MRKTLLFLLVTVTLMAGCTGCSEPIIIGPLPDPEPVTLCSRIAGTTWNCRKPCNLTARKVVSSVLFQETETDGVLTIVLKSGKDGGGSTVELLRLDEATGTCAVSRNGSATGNSLVAEEDGLTLTLKGIEAMELEKLP